MQQLKTQSKQYLPSTTEAVKLKFANIGPFGACKKRQMLKAELDSRTVVVENSNETATAKTAMLIWFANSLEKLKIYHK